MPRSASSLLWASLPIVLVAIVYQTCLRDSLIDLLPVFLSLAAAGNEVSTTYCYTSVKTLSNGLDSANCFSVSNGKFSKVFNGDSRSSVTENKRTGHVIPGLWDGHGHLYQYGESLHSVDLFGSGSMEEVQKRLVEYKNSHANVGTSEQWLRGVGWDQANFEGRWPVAVCPNHSSNIHRRLIRYSQISRLVRTSRISTSCWIE
jgi:hypothetical protein